MANPDTSGPGPSGDLPASRTESPALQPAAASSVEDRVGELEHRVAAIEQVLLRAGFTRGASTPAVAAAAAPALPRAAAIDVAAPSSTLEPTQEPAPPRRAGVQKFEVVFAPPHARHTPGTPQAQAVPPSLDSGSILRGVSFEKAVGVAFAVLGALMLVAGVAFALLWAYQQGLLRVPPIWRCSLAAGFGFALVGVGELLRRRYGSWVSAGSSSAGIGIIFASVFMAFRLYDLLGEGSAFVLLALTAGFGIAVAARSRLSVVGIISLIAGYMTPILVGGESPSPWIFPMYLLALLAVGLALSGWLRGSFVAMRSIAWWGTILLGGAWATGGGSGGLESHSLAAATFLGLVWAMVHAELWWSVAWEDDSDDAKESWSKRAHTLRAWRPFSASIATSAFSVGVGILVLRAWGTVPDWCAPAAGVMGAAGIGLALASHLRLLVETPRTGRERLGATLLVQAGALLLATIALATSGSGAILCWVLLASASGVAGRVLRAPALIVYSIVSLSIATLRLAMWDSWNGPLHTAPFEFAGLAFTWWTGFMLIVAGVWVGLAWILRRLAMPLTRAEMEEAGMEAPPVGTGGAIATAKDQRPSELAMFAWPLGVVGVIAGLASLLHTEAAALSIGVAWAAVCGVLVMVGGRAGEIGLRRGAFVGLVGSTVAWMGSVTMHPWSDSTAPALLHPALWAASLISGMIACGWWMLRGAQARPDFGDSSRALAVACIIWGGLLIFIATSLEAARVAFILTDNARLEPVGVTLAWGGIAAGLLVAGFAWRSVIVRRVGLGLLATAGFKAALVDLAGVPLIGRVASFMVLGVLMLVVAAVYARLERKLAPPEPAA